MRVRADSDDEMIPIWGGRVQEKIPDSELENFRHPKHQLGGTTIGEELCAWLLVAFSCMRAYSRPQLCRRTACERKGAHQLAIGDAARIREEYLKSERSAAGELSHLYSKNWCAASCVSLPAPFQFTSRCLSYVYAT
jgi:hypothetical protein